MLTNTQRKTKLLAVNKDGRYKCKSQLYKHPFFELVIGHHYNLALVIAFGIALRRSSLQSSHGYRFWYIALYCSECHKRKNSLTFKTQFCFNLFIVIIYNIYMLTRLN